MNTILEISIRTIVSFIILLILTRILGKKQLGQMTFFTYITGIAMGSIAAEVAVQRDVKLVDGIVGLIIWTFFTVILEYISLKSVKARVLLDGEPAIVIKKGVIQKKALFKERLNMDDLTMLLRNNNIFSMSEVDYAILEPNGQLSVLKNPEEGLLTKKDMNIQIPERKYMPTEIIVDGRVVLKNLRELGLDLGWLQEQLKNKNIECLDEIFFAELQSDGSLFINKKQVTPPER